MKDFPEIYALKKLKIAEQEGIRGRRCFHDSFLIILIILSFCDFSFRTLSLRLRKVS